MKLAYDKFELKIFCRNDPVYVTIVCVHVRKINFYSCHQLQEYFYNKNSRFTVHVSFFFGLLRI